MLKKEKQNPRWAEKVRQARGRLTQSQFATKLGVSVATVRNWEYGRAGGDDSIYQLSITTGKPPSYFTGNPDDDASFRKRYGDELPAANDAKPLPTVAAAPAIPEGPTATQEPIVQYRHAATPAESQRRNIQEIYVSVLKIQSAFATVASDLAKILIELEGK